MPIIRYFIPQIIDVLIHLVSRPISLKLAGHFVMKENAIEVCCFLKEFSACQMPGPQLSDFSIYIVYLQNIKACRKKQPETHPVNVVFHVAYYQS